MRRYVRKTLIIIFFFLSIASFSQINTNTSFRVTGQLPIDTRFIFTDTNSRNDLFSGERYEGLFVYTIAEEKYWYLSKGIGNENWKEFSGKYQIELTSDAQNNIELPFTLNSSAIIIYNNTPLRTNQWSGAATLILSLLVNTKMYDQLVIIN